jgi:hypothetical protein
MFLLVLAMFPNIFSIAPPFFYPICFGKCCLALTGPAPSVLPHIKAHADFFFILPTEQMGNFWNFFVFLVKIQLVLPVFFGKSNFQYQKIDSPKKKKKTMMVM